MQIWKRWGVTNTGWKHNPKDVLDSTDLEGTIYIFATYRVAKMNDNPPCCSVQCLCGVRESFCQL